MSDTSPARAAPCHSAAKQGAHTRRLSHHHRLTPVSAVALMIAALILGGCAGGPGGAGSSPEPAGEPYIEGQVTSVTPFTPVTENCVDGSDLDPDSTVSSDDPPICSSGDEGPGQILVEEVPDGNKASLTIAQGTGVWRETADGLEPAEFADLTVGQTAAAWVSGPVAESFPVQATADDVVIRAP